MDIRYLCPVVYTHLTSWKINFAISTIISSSTLSKAVNYITSSLTKFGVDVITSLKIGHFRKSQDR